MDRVSLTKPLVFGPFGSSIIEMPLAASEVFKHASGHFMQANGSGYIIHADATSVDIIGWAFWGQDTGSSTAGVTSVAVETDLEKLFVMPTWNSATGAVPTEAVLKVARGETCDIYVASNIQYCDVGASSIDILIFYGYDYDDNTGKSYAIVKCNIEKIVNTGAA